MLLKLALCQPIKTALKLGKPNRMLKMDGEVKCVWDLSKNLDREEMPDQVASCVKFTLLAKINSPS